MPLRCSGALPKQLFFIVLDVLLSWHALKLPDRLSESHRPESIVPPRNYPSASARHAMHQGIPIP